AGTLPVGGTGGTSIPPPPEPTGGSGGCKNLQCRQTVCPEGSETTVTGTVYAPNGTLPIYNALVYVPNAPLTDFSPGLACDRCGALPAGEPVVSAVTDAQGGFRLVNVPVGANVPIVIQVGKWRRELVVPDVAACAETVLDDAEATRLPRNRSEGDMPRIAVTTGSCDNLVCLIAKLGIDPDEWGVAGDDKAVTFYRGKPLDFDPHKDDRFTGALAGMTDASELWGNYATLSGYDVSIFSCECEEALENKGSVAYDAVTRYLAAGGRVFGTDYQYVWYQHATDPNWVAATTVTGAAPDGAPLGDTTIRLDTSFPKGKALADWLAVIAPENAYAEVMSTEVFDNFSAARSGVTQVWGSSGTLADPTLAHPRFLTVNMPAAAPVTEQCGKAAHLDAHITALSPAEFMHFPESCGAELANGEQVLAFFFFDLAACIQEDSKPVVPPPTTEPH
ncbi:MAG TPA: carboxypeptidase-like regulatory domain-containing protein, partial [Polyangiaceae bacterium]|nr:carboxypeptidase-like regulatory domain-containing protein [Polyangiaceae bacterium]